jgi:hypothetical protein
MLRWNEYVAFTKSMSCVFVEINDLGCECIIIDFISSHDIFESSFEFLHIGLHILFFNFDFFQ